MKNQKYIIAIFLAATFWGFIGVFVKALTSIGLSSFQMGAVRTFFAAIFLFIFLFIFDRKAIRIKLCHCHFFIGTGIFSLMLFNWCYFNAINASSMSVAAVLLYTAPIFVLIMSSILFKEKITPKKLLALIATFAGCVLVSGIFSAGESIGITALLLGLGSGIGYSLYSIFGKYALAEYKPLTVTLWTLTFAAVGCILLSVLENGFTLPAEIFTTKGVFATLGIAIICCALPYMFYTYGLSGVDSGKASIMATLEPAVATIIGISLFQEQISPAKALGMVLILSSVIILSIKGKEVKVED